MSTTSHEYETTVKNGFPVVFHYFLAPAEPDIGINFTYIEDYYFTTVKGKRCDWLKIDQREIDRIEETVLDMWSE